MPNTSSAKKALRSSLKKRDYNLKKKFQIRTALKNFRKALETDAKTAQIAISTVYSALDKAVKTNFIAKNTANRKKSRVAAMLAKISNNISNN